MEATTGSYRDLWAAFKGLGAQGVGDVVGREYDGTPLNGRCGGHRGFLWLAELACKKEYTRFRLGVESSPRMI